MDEGHSVREVHSEGEELKYIWEEEKQQEEEGDLTPEVIEQMCVCVSTQFWDTYRYYQA